VEIAIKIASKIVCRKWMRHSPAFDIVAQARDRRSDRVLGMDGGQSLKAYMSSHLVHVRELMGWGLDDYEYRPERFEHERLRQAAHLVAQRERYEQAKAVLAPFPTRSGERSATFRKNDCLDERVCRSRLAGQAPRKAVL
jgi:hypothetical protein